MVLALRVADMVCEEEIAEFLCSFLCLFSEYRIFWFYISFFYSFFDERLFILFVWKDSVEICKIPVIVLGLFSEYRISDFWFVLHSFYDGRLWIFICMFTHDFLSDLVLKEPLTRAIASSWWASVIFICLCSCHFHRGFCHALYSFLSSTKNPSSPSMLNSLIVRYFASIAVSSTYKFFIRLRCLYWLQLFSFAFLSSQRLGVFGCSYTLLYFLAPVNQS